MMKLTGYKTYAVAALLALVAAGKYMGYIPAGVAEALEGILVGGGLAALRNGVGTPTQKR